MNISAQQILSINLQKLWLIILTSKSTKINMMILKNPDKT